MNFQNHEALKSRVVYVKMRELQNVNDWLPEVT